MTDAHDRLFESISGHVLATLEPDEAAAVERHLDAGCARCEAAMLEATSTLEALADTVPPVSPSETTRARVLAAAGGRGEASGTFDHSGAGPTAPLRWLPWAAAAMLALLAWGAATQRDLRREVEQLARQRAVDTSELAALREDLARARSQLGRYELANRIAAASDLSSVQLAGLDAAPEASARALVEGGRARAVLYVSNLTPPAPDRTYQLWVIIGGEPVSAGLFDVDGDGGASVVVEKLDRADEIEAWAVTLEPEGGVPQPTGPMVLMGAVA